MVEGFVLISLFTL